jgi:N-acetylneuraminic acid mutarotase
MGKGFKLNRAVISTGEPVLDLTDYDYIKLENTPGKLIKSGNKWETKTVLPIARYGLTAAAIDGIIYAIGGNVSPYNRNDAYDPVSNTWSSKTIMTTGRWFLSPTTPVVNGIAYVMGGRNTKSLDINEAYNPITNLWENKAIMSVARQSIAACAVNGIIYVFGGYNGTTYFDINEAYNPITNLWENKAVMSSARGKLCCNAVNGIIYVFGDSGGSYNLNMAYNPATNLWESKQVMPTGAFTSTATVVDDLIYVIGGYTSTYINLNQVYDPVTNTWSAKVNMTTARNQLAAAAVNDVIYLIGGSSSGGALDKNEAYTPLPDYEFQFDKDKNSAEIYNLDVIKLNTKAKIDGLTILANKEIIYKGGSGLKIIAHSATLTGTIKRNKYQYDYVYLENNAGNMLQSGDAWTTKAAMLTARNEPCAAAVNGFIYVIGGEGGTQKNEAYDTTLNTWASKADALLGTYYASAVTVDGYIYCMAGAGQTTMNYMYDPVANNWTSKAAVKTGRYQATAQAVNGVVYLIGGDTGSPSNLNEAYDPITNTWSTKQVMPTARKFNPGSAVINDIIYVFGGFTSTGRSKKNEAYDPVTNTWSTKADMPTGRRQLVGVAANGMAYAIGGDADAGTSIANEEYDPILNTWSVKISPTVVRLTAAAAEVNGTIYVMGGMVTPAFTNSADNEAYRPLPEYEYTVDKDSAVLQVSDLDLVKLDKSAYFGAQQISANKEISYNGDTLSSIKSGYSPLTGYIRRNRYLNG